MSSTPINPKHIQRVAHSPRLLPTARQRMVWKECRQNAPLLVVFVAMLALTLGLSKYFVQMQPSSAAYGQAFWLPIIWTFTNIFALTIGVFIFAPEKENRTDQLLGILPISSGFAVRTKLWVGLATIICFVLIAGLFQLIEVYMIGSRLPPALSGQNNIFPGMATAIAAITLIAIVFECFCWGAICSLFAKRAIVAALMATGCFILFSWLLPSLCSIAVAEYLSPAPALVAFLTGKTLIYVGMGLAVVHLGRDWLGHTPSNQAAASASEQTASEIVVGKRASSRATTKIYSSLIWQSFRQYGSGFLIALAVTAPLFALGIAATATIQDGVIDSTFVVITLLIVLSSIPLVGSMFVFLEDHQDRNYRFFQQHAEFGRKLWFARLLPAGLLSLICALALVVTIYLVGRFLPRVDDGYVNALQASEYVFLYRAVFAGVLVVFSAFAIGQFSSMFFRSGVFTFVCAIFLSAIALTWIGWLSFLNVNLWFYFAPIPASLLFITWWRAPDWLADRNRVHDLSIPWFALVTVAGCVFGAMVYHRIHEIPETLPSLTQQSAILENVEAVKMKPERGSVEQPGFALWDAADAVVGAQKLLDADLRNHFELGLTGQYFEGSVRSKPVKNMGPLNEFIAANSTALERLHQADGNYDSTQILNPESERARHKQIRELELLMIAEARKSELDGDLKHALEHWLRYAKFQDTFFGQGNYPSASYCLVRWSELPGQTPELIKLAIAGLEFTEESWRQRANNESFSAQLDFKNWYDELKQGIDGDAMQYSVFFQHPAGSRLPWEMERSRRIAQNTISLLPTRREIFSFLAIEPGMSYRGYLGANFFEAFERAIGTTPFDELRNELFILDGFGRWQEVFQIMKLIQIRRYARVRMALNAWRLEHEAYPEQLVQLVPDYLEQLPVDLFFGGNLTYSPTGKNAKVGWSMELRRDNLVNGQSEYLMNKSSFAALIPADTPFLLPWTSYVDTTPVTCSIQKEDHAKPFEVYNFASPNGSVYNQVQPEFFSFSLKKPEATHTD